ncbi:MAG: laccase domain-containing protein, partial [Pseudomonadota bacterium]
MTADFAIERAPILDGAAHGFFGSAGGVHQFGYGGPGEVADVRELRAAAAQAIAPGARIIAPHQQHTPDVITLGDAWDDTPKGRPVADAVVTATKGLALGIVTADCAPVLLADIEAGVIGAAHAGWRGAKGGV